MFDASRRHTGSATASLLKIKLLILLPYLVLATRPQACSLCKSISAQLPHFCRACKHAGAIEPQLTCRNSTVNCWNTLEYIVSWKSSRRSGIPAYLNVVDFQQWACWNRQAGIPTVPPTAVECAGICWNSITCWNPSHCRNSAALDCAGFHQWKSWNMLEQLYAGIPKLESSMTNFPT